MTERVIPIDFKWSTLPIPSDGEAKCCIVPHCVAHYMYELKQVLSACVCVGVCVRAHALVCVWNTHLLKYLII